MPKMMDMLDVNAAARTMREVYTEPDGADWCAEHGEDLLFTVETLLGVKRRYERANKSMAGHITATGELVEQIGQAILDEGGGRVPKTIPVERIQKVISTQYPKCLAFGWTAEAALLHDKESEIRDHVDKRLRERMEAEARAKGTPNAEKVVRELVKMAQAKRAQQNAPRPQSRRQKKRPLDPGAN